MSEQNYDPNKGYVALLGWSLNAIEAADKFDRRYVVVAPDFAAHSFTSSGSCSVPYGERIRLVAQRRYSPTR